MIHPESAVGFQTLAIALSADGQLDDGRRAFERGEALDPSERRVLLAQRALRSCRSVGMKPTR